MSPYTFCKFSAEVISNMYSQQFRKLGRSLLAASAVSLGAASLVAQTPAAPAPPSGPNPSRVDVFLGYSYIGPHGVVKPAGIAYSSVDVGAIGSVAYYFNKYAGAEVSYATHPDGRNDGMSFAQGGVIFRAPMPYFTLFAHGLAGGAYVGGPNTNGAFFAKEPYRWGPSLTAGGGMDYNLPKVHGFNLAFRLFQADYVYFHEDYGPAQTAPTGAPLGGRANINSAQLSSGLVLKFGSIIPPPPVTYTCAVSPTSAYAGDPITVTGTAMNLNPKKTATYSWTSDGGKITGTSNVANIDTTGANAGTYNIKGHVSEGTKAGQFADCTVPFTINPPAPPTITCSANPSSVNPGDTSTITSSANSPQNRPLTYSYSSTSGSISGSSSTATLTTVGAAPGTITVTCNVADDKGQTASATTSVNVMAPAAPPVISTQQLCAITFNNDKKRPTRVDNEAKACLDDIASNLKRSSDAKLAITGNGDGKMGAERAVNEKAYLTTGEAGAGIDPSRIMVFSGNDGSNSVTNTLIPAGATMGSYGTPVDESMIKAKSRTAPAPRHRRHKK